MFFANSFHEIQLLAKKSFIQLNGYFQSPVFSWNVLGNKHETKLSYLVDRY